MSEQTSEVREGVARLEERMAALQERVTAECVERKERDCRLEDKIDQILHNDKDKLQRIKGLETRMKVVWGVLAAVGTALVPVVIGVLS